MSITLKSDATSYLFLPPPGKPNTKIPLENGSADLRPRVTQSPQKGPNCRFYALNILRPRIGPNPGSDHTQTRELEVLYSTLSKSRTALAYKLKFVLSRLFQTLGREGVLPNGKRETIERLLHIIRGVLERISTPTRNLLELFPYFEEFCAQTEYDDVHAFFEKKYKTLEAEVYMQFLDSMGISPKEQYETLARAEIRQHLKDASHPQADSDATIDHYFSIYPSWQMILENSSTILHAFSSMAASKALGFQLSDWTPLETVEKLQGCLRSEGALVVGGWFGESLYSGKPFVSKTIDGRPIYSWRPSDRHTFDGPIELAEGHAIVIIGAEQGGTKGGYVYFVDPKDGSDPEDPLKQKIYMISYENFVTNISDLRGSRQQEGKRSIHGYAQFYPQADTN